MTMDTTETGILFNLHARGAKIGELAVATSWAPQATQALSSAGIETEELGALGGDPDTALDSYTPPQSRTGADAVPVWALESQCNLEATHPCDLKAVLGAMQEVGNQSGVPTDEIDAIEARGWVTDAEAMHAIRAVYDRLPPEDQNGAGDAVVEAAESVIHGASLAREMPNDTFSA